MPYLISLITTIATSIGGLLFSLTKAVGFYFSINSFQLAQKIVYSTILITIYTGALITFIATLNSSFSDLLAGLPYNSFSAAGLSLLPPNAITCALIIAALKGGQGLLYVFFGIIKLRVKFF